MNQPPTPYNLIYPMDDRSTSMHRLFARCKSLIIPVWAFQWCANLSCQGSGIPVWSAGFGRMDEHHEVLNPHFRSKRINRSYDLYWFSIPKGWALGVSMGVLCRQKNESGDNGDSSFPFLIPFLKCNGQKKVWNVNFETPFMGNCFKPMGIYICMISQDFP